MNVAQQLKDVFLKKTDVLGDILGQAVVKNQMKAALIADHHILVIGPPGIGKTTLAKNLAKLLPDIEVNDCQYHCDPKNPVCPTCKSGGNIATKKVAGRDRFVRIQGSPDLTAEDLIGDIDPVKALKFGPLSMEAFTPGKVFKANNGVLFFDELNRCPEKLQNALLQVLAERKATIGSYDVDLDANFLFIATMNPEDTSTETLSDVLLDRFEVAYMGYPESASVEKEIVTSQGKSFVNMPDGLTNFLVSFVQELRDSDRLEKHPSVRASLGLYELSQTNALLNGKKTADIDDLKAAILSVIPHRIKLKPSAQYLQSPREFVEEALTQYLEHKGTESAGLGGSL